MYTLVQLNIKPFSISGTFNNLQSKSIEITQRELYFKPYERGDSGGVAVYPLPLPHLSCVMSLVSCDLFTAGPTSLAHLDILVLVL